jgi:hypothetical protein
VLTSFNIRDRLTNVYSDESLKSCRECEDTVKRTRAKPLRYQDRTINSVGEALAALKQQAKSNQLRWFRGQANKNWKLVPSLAREAKHLRAESALIKRFMQNATPHIAVPPRDEWEWIFLMQHHRAGTRLLLSPA